MTTDPPVLENLVTAAESAFNTVLGHFQAHLQAEGIGVVHFVGNGIALVTGLPGIRSEELVRFPDNLLGLAFNVDAHEVGVILLGETAGLKAGTEVQRTGRVLDVPVGEALLGRVVDSLGRPLDDLGPVQTMARLPVERDAPPIMHRAPVTVPLQTGLKVVDALIPIGRGQRELILGDRQTGKTTIALDTILNQQGQGVICLYCSIGQRDSAVAQIIADLRRYGAMDYCTVVVAPGEAPPGLHFVAPFAATSMAEYFMEQGRDVLIIYDNLTNHARSYRELSLLLRRPPGREAYPGDIFYLHARLLERSTHLLPEYGGGSLTALPIVETEAGNIAAYIPTNLISITDGQLYLRSDFFQKGILPAVDVGKSVSRVGGKAQLAAYRAVAGDLRLSYSQFQELEAFSRFGTRMDERTRQLLERGYREREVLKQPPYDPLPVAQQIIVLLAVTHGFFDAIALDRLSAIEPEYRRQICDRLPDLCQRITAGNDLTAADQAALLQHLQALMATLSDNTHGNH
jgi:F-type H+/Na+-transporting ATPase subunit alpha